MADASTTRDAWVRQLHDSDMFGVFAETGAGCPVAAALFDVSGASRTILTSFQPYGKGTAPSLLGAPVDEETVRAVSRKHVRNLREGILVKWKDAGINTAFASSFQVGGDVSTVTHGWVAIAYKDTRREFHLTLRPPTGLAHPSRREQIEWLGDACLGLLHYMLAPNSVVMAEIIAHMAVVHIDGVYCDESGGSCVRECIELMARRHPDSQDSYLVVDRTGQLIRLETLCRDKSRLVLFKGSFNPPTVEHVRIFEEANNDVPSSASASAFMISIDTVDKGTVDASDIARRVQLINALGYACIINRRGYFASCIRFMRDTFPAMALTFPVGADTYTRISPEDQTLADFQVSPRTPCSSTEVRTLLATAASKRTAAQQGRLTELLPSSLHGYLL